MKRHNNATIRSSPTSLARRCGTAFVAAAGLLCCGSSAFGVNVIADYQFHHNFNSSAGAAAPLATLNNVLLTTDLVDQRGTDVAYFSLGSGFLMNVPPEVVTGGYTVVLLFSFNDTSGYRKIMDFKQRTIDDGLYNLSQSLAFYPDGFGAPDSMPMGIYVQVTLTRTAAGLVSTYVDGIPQFSFSDPAGHAVPISGSINLLIDDLHTGGAEGGTGRLARLRLYDTALSAQEVASLDRAASNGCESADFNCDGDVATDADIEAFFACIAGTCPGLHCWTNADFNGDGDVATDADIEAFFRVLAGGNC